jgi:hypothetical protein
MSKRLVTLQNLQNGSQMEAANGESHEWPKKDTKSNSIILTIPVHKIYWTKEVNGKSLSFQFNDFNSIEQKGKKTIQQKGKTIQQKNRTLDNRRCRNFRK